MYIPHSEYTHLKNELERLTKPPQTITGIISCGARKWLTEKSLAMIEEGLKLTPDSSEQSVMIAIDGIKINGNLTQKVIEARKTIAELKARIVELEKA